MRPLSPRRIFANVYSYVSLHNHKSLELPGMESCPSILMPPSRSIELQVPLPRHLGSAHASSLGYQRQSSHNVQLDCGWLEKIVEQSCFYRNNHKNPQDHWYSQPQNASNTQIKSLRSSIIPMIVCRIE